VQEAEDEEGEVTALLLKESPWREETSNIAGRRMFAIWARNVGG